MSSVYKYDMIGIIPSVTNTSMISNNLILAYDKLK